MLFWEIAMTPATFDKLSETQQECLGYYAFPGLSMPRLWPQNTLNSLVKKGLLICHKRPLGDGGMPVMVEDYEMPIAAHIAYCEWLGDIEEIP
jgi:hypothetical protein